MILRSGLFKYAKPSKRFQQKWRYQKDEYSKTVKEMCDKDGEFALHNSKLFKLKPFSMWSNNLAVFRNIAIRILAIIVVSAAGYFQGGNIMVIATWTLIQRSWHHCILPSLTQNWIEVVTWSTQHVIKSNLLCLSLWQLCPYSIIFRLVRYFTSRLT